MSCSFHSNQRQSNIKTDIPIYLINHKYIQWHILVTDQKPVPKTVLSILDKYLICCYNHNPQGPRSWHKLMLKAVKAFGG